MEGPGGVLPPADLFTRLSDEVVLHILTFVPWPDVHARAALVCRRWWAITKEPLPFHTPLRTQRCHSPPPPPTRIPFCLAIVLIALLLLFFFK
jgi:hypothetical protein